MRVSQSGFELNTIKVLPNRQIASSWGEALINFVCKLIDAVYMNMTIIPPTNTSAIISPAHLLRSSQEYPARAAAIATSSRDTIKGLDD